MNTQRVLILTLGVILFLLVAGYLYNNLYNTGSKEGFDYYIPDGTLVSNNDDYRYSFAQYLPFNFSLPWFNRFFYYPYLRPQYFRNYGELYDPYYPSYYTTFYDDSEYYYEPSYKNNFKQYRKVWGNNKRQQPTWSKSKFKLVPACNTKTCIKRNK